MEKSEIVSVMKFMNAIYTKKIEISKDSVEAWSFMLDGDGTTKELVKQAIKRHSLASRYPPDLPEIKDQLVNCFTIGVERLTDINIITVDFPLSGNEHAHGFPFVIAESEKANELIAFLKKLPDYEKVRNYYKNHLIRIQEKGRCQTQEKEEDTDVTKQLLMENI